MSISSKSIFYAKLLAIITLITKKIKIENNDSETSIIKNSPLFAMLLNIAEAYEMLQFSENKADAHNEVISVLPRHEQRRSGKFSFWMLSLGFHEKTLRSQIMDIFF